MNRLTAGTKITFQDSFIFGEGIILSDDNDLGLGLNNLIYFVKCFSATPVKGGPFPEEKRLNNYEVYHYEILEVNNASN